MVDGNNETEMEGLSVPDRHDLSDEVPIADAVEQQQDFVPQPRSVPEPSEVPIEASPPDWQEQLQEVAGEDDHDEYR